MTFEEALAVLEGAIAGGITTAAKLDEYVRLAGDTPKDHCPKCMGDPKAKHDHRTCLEIVRDLLVGSVGAIEAMRDHKHDFATESGDCACGADGHA